MKPRGKVFEAGNKGKPKGAVNKVTQKARELFVNILEGEVDYLKASLEKVRKKDPARYLEIYAKYAQYFVPKQTEVKSTVEMIPTPIIQLAADTETK